MFAVAVGFLADFQSTPRFCSIGDTGDEAPVIILVAASLRLLFVVVFITHSNCHLLVIACRAGMRERAIAPQENTVSTALENFQHEHTVETTVPPNRNNHDEQRSKPQLPLVFKGFDWF